MMRIVIPRSRVRELWRRVALALVAVVALALYLIPTTHHAIEYWWEPRPAPDTTTLETQRVTAEDAMARAFAKGSGQLASARALTLPIGATEADSIVRDYNGQLRTLRRQALLYAIAHELRSPLTSIQAFAELLETDRTLIDSDNDLLLSSLSRGVDRLATFVNDLLDLGRVESGLRVTVGTMDVTEALRGAETMLRPSFMSREQALSLELPDEPLLAIGDERALEQVMLNLLSNANRFTPARGAVTVRAVTRNGRVHVEVQDSGPGIDPRDRVAIFDPFYRVHRAGAPEVPGSGLGLAVARRLTEMMGGRIWADGVEGASGTLFCIELLGAELDAPA